MNNKISEKKNRVFDIIVNYDSRDLAHWITDILPESALDEIIEDEEENRKLEECE